MRLCKVPMRKREWHSKSKGGCKTCKTRRVRCGEEKPQCRRCLATGWDCEGYAENVRPWLFVSSSTRREEIGVACPAKGNLSTCISNSLFGSPYKTRESQAALQLWCRLTDPTLTDSPVPNELYCTLGEYVPQAAWNSNAVRHSLLSAASTALVLEGRSKMSPELQHNLSKQSIVHTHLAIRGVLEERQASPSSILAAMMLGIIYLWTGRWEGCKKNIYSSVNLSREVRVRGEYVADELITTIETMAEIVDLIPPKPIKLAKRASIRYAYRVVTAAKLWIEKTTSDLASMQAYAFLELALDNYHIRTQWLLTQWREHGQEDNHLDAIDIEKTAFAPAVHHLQSSFLESGGTQSLFDIRLLTTQLTLALKFTSLYGACGDAQKLRDAAIACHHPVSALSDS